MMVFETNFVARRKVHIKVNFPPDLGMWQSLHVVFNQQAPELRDRHNVILALILKPTIVSISCG